MKGIILLALTVVTASLVAAVAVSTAHATFPGANGRISLMRYDASIDDFALYTANPDLSKEIEVAGTPTFSSAWAPGGGRLAYDIVEADGSNQIATVNGDGTGRQVLTSGSGINEIPSYSPDGTRIVYDYSPVLPDVPGFHTSLWVMDANGTNKHPLFPGWDTFDVEPKFSPDGQSVAFIRIRKVMGRDGSLQQNALFVVRADGTGLRQLTAWGQSAEFPDWAPDSRSLVYFDSAESGGKRSIWMIGADGGSRHVVYQGQRGAEGARPAFSPDGTKIMFSCIGPKGGDTDLCRVDADGSNLVDLTNTPNGSDERRPAWGTAQLR